MEKDSTQPVTALKKVAFYQTDFLFIFITNAQKVGVDFWFLLMDIFRLLFLVFLFLSLHFLPLYHR